MKSASNLAGLLIAFLSFTAFAQAATVTGTVKSPDGTPFRGAFVQAQNTTTRVLVSVLTDKNGRYQIENLPAG
jgi:Carboxypeptidase regulatory-like domain